MSHADVTEAIHHTLVIQDVVGGHEVCEKCRVGEPGRSCRSPALCGHRQSGRRGRQQAAARHAVWQTADALDNACSSLAVLYLMSSHGRCVATRTRRCMRCRARGEAGADYSGGVSTHRILQRRHNRLQARHRGTADPAVVAVVAVARYGLVGRCRIRRARQPRRPTAA